MRKKENWEVAIDALQRSKQGLGPDDDPVWIIAPKQRLLDFYRRLLATDAPDDLVVDDGLGRAARAACADQAKQPQPDAGGWVSIDPFGYGGVPRSPWDSDQAGDANRRSISHAV